VVCSGCVSEHCTHRPWIWTDLVWFCGSCAPEGGVGTPLIWFFCAQVFFNHSNRKLDIVFYWPEGHMLSHIAHFGPCREAIFSVFLPPLPFHDMLASVDWTPGTTWKGRGWNLTTSRVCAFWLRHTLSLIRAFVVETTLASLPLWIVDHGTTWYLGGLVDRTPACGRLFGPVSN